MPRGGARQGTPGQAYGNRTDLQNAVNQDQTKQVNPQARAAAQRAAQPQQPMGRPELSADDVPSLFAPDQHPDTPVTAGLPGGPGPGPEALNVGVGPINPAVADLQAVYAMYPYEGIRRLLDAFR